MMKAACPAVLQLPPCQTLASCSTPCLGLRLYMLRWLELSQHHTITNFLPYNRLYRSHKTITCHKPQPHCCTQQLSPPQR